jgi:hypothetical protein
MGFICGGFNPGIFRLECARVDPASGDGGCGNGKAEQPHPKLGRRITKNPATEVLTGRAGPTLTASTTNTASLTTVTASASDTARTAHRAVRRFSSTTPFSTLTRH